MKGLLLKDWYMMRTYCRPYLLLAVLFLALSCVSHNDTIFFTFYPCLLCGIIPINLLSYDERSGWTRYSGTLPYKKSQFVAVKYLTGLLSLCVVLVATAAAQTIKMMRSNAFSFRYLFMVLLAISVVTLLSSAICLPFVFRLGTEKGRIISLLLVALFFAGIAAVPALLSGSPIAGLRPDVLLLFLGLASIAIYLFSWYLSVLLYKRREI